MKNVEKKENNCIEKVKILLKKWRVPIITVIAMVIVTVPFMIDCAYMHGLKLTETNTEFSASDLLAFYGSFLSFIGTVALGALALWQNHNMKELTIRLDARQYRPDFYVRYDSVIGNNDTNDINCYYKIRKIEDKGTNFTTTIEIDNYLENPVFNLLPHLLLTNSNKYTFGIGFDKRNYSIDYELKKVIPKNPLVQNEHIFCSLDIPKQIGDCELIFVFENAYREKYSKQIECKIHNCKQCWRLEITKQHPSVRQ